MDIPVTRYISFAQRSQLRIVPIGATPNRCQNREDPHTILCSCRVEVSRELQIGLLFKCSLSAINRTSTTLGLNKRRRQSVGQKNGRKEESNVSCLETSHRFVVLVSEEEVRDIEQKFRHHNTILFKLNLSSNCLSKEGLSF